MLKGPWDISIYHFRNYFNVVLAMLIEDKHSSSLKGKRINLMVIASLSPAI